MLPTHVAEFLAQELWGIFTVIYVVIFRLIPPLQGHSIVAGNQGKWLIQAVFAILESQIRSANASIIKRL